MGLSASCCTHAFAVLNKRSLVAKVEIPPEMAKKTRTILRSSGDKQEKRRVNQQVQNYKTCLKNSHFGLEKFNFSLGLSFNFFCMDIILLSV